MTTTPIIFNLQLDATSLNIRTTDVAYSPSNHRDFSTFKIGRYHVQRHPLRNTPFTQYCILFEGELLGKQISFPNAADCNTFANLNDGDHDGAAKSRNRTFNNGNLAGRMVAILQRQEMDVRELASAMDKTVTTLSPKLKELVASGAVIQRGSPRRHRYKAA